MQNQDLTKEQLLEELQTLRQRVAELEAQVASSNSDLCTTSCVSDISTLQHRNGDQAIETLRSDQCSLESAIQYREILENAVIGFFQSVPDRGYITVNQSMATLLGYSSPAELIGSIQRIDEQIYIDRAQRDAFKQRLNQYSTVAEHECQVRCKDGSVIWISESVRAVHSDQGELLYYEGSSLDITERKAAEVELQRIKTELEQIVEERTAALKASNDQLIAEVAERQQAEDALQAAKDQLQAVLDAVPGIVSWISADLRYLGVNRHLAKMFDLPADAFPGQDIGFLGSGLEFREFVKRFFESSSQDAYRQVSAIVKGQPRNYLIVAQKYDSDRAAFIVGIDITERHEAEHALRHAEANYRAIFENAVEGIFQTTIDGYYLSANPALARIYGYETPDDLMSNLSDISKQLYVNPQRRVDFVEQLNRYGSIVRFESQVYRRDGSLIWISENARIVRDEDSNPLYYEGTVEDITELKQAQEALQKANEELETRVEDRTVALKVTNQRLLSEISERQRIEAALRASEAELRALFAAMTDVITVFDAEGRYCKIVTTNSQLLYRPKVDRIGKTIYDILSPTQATLFAIHIQRALNTGKTLNLEYSLPIGEPDLNNPGRSLSGTPLSEAWYNATISPLPDQRVLWVARNITERKRVEEALRRAEEKYRSIFENAAEGIFQTTPYGRCLSANPALVRMYGYSSPKDLMTSVQNMGDLYVQPQRRAELIAILESRDSISQFVSQAYRKDGSKIWISENARVVRDNSGRTLYYEGTVEDITKSKQAEEALRQSETRQREKSRQLAQALEELKQAQAQLVQSEKMSSLGQLMAGVAHEINNPVNFIYGNLAYATKYTQELLKLLQLYHETLPDVTTELREQVEKVDLEFLMQDLPKLLASMRIGAERIREIVRSLRNFSRHDEAEVKLVDIHQGIDSTLMILQHRLKADSGKSPIRVLKKYGKLPQVKCYAGQLNQVFMNILSNAIDALRDLETSGSFANGTPLPSQFEPTITIRTEPANGDRIQIRIADNGAGIPEKFQKQIFDPFFTTKDIGKGTGLGLSISHQVVVDRHHGLIQCTSQPGKGTEFAIEIPVLPQE